MRGIQIKEYVKVRYGNDDGDDDDDNIPLAPF